VLRIFWPKRVEWRTWHIQELNILCSSSDTVRIIN